MPEQRIQRTREAYRRPDYMHGNVLRCGTCHDDIKLTLLPMTCRCGYKWSPVTAVDLVHGVVSQ